MKFIKTILITSLSFQVLATEPPTFEKLKDEINKDTFKQMTSVVVSQDQKIILEEYFNDANKDTQHDMRSASKSLTSLAIGFAIEDNLIESLNKPVMDYFADKRPLKNPDSRKSAMTIQDLITMSSPVECDDWNSTSRGNEERMYLIEDWSQFILDLPIRGTPPWKKTAKESKYGRSFSYCTGGVQILTELVERATKMKMAKYLQTKLFSKLDIKPPQFQKTSLGLTNGGGGARMTSMDWIKLGELLINEGKHKNQQIINKKWIEESLIRRVVIEEERDIEYGYLWWIFNFKLDDKIVTAYAASGNGGNYMFAIPEFNATAVITSTAFNTNYMHKQSHQILQEYVLPNLAKNHSKKK